MRAQDALSEPSLSIDPQQLGRRGGEIRGPPGCECRPVQDPVACVGEFLIEAVFVPLVDVLIARQPVVDLPTRFG